MLLPLAETVLIIGLNVLGRRRLNELLMEGRSDRSNSEYCLFDMLRFQNENNI